MVSLNSIRIIWIGCMKNFTLRLLYLYLFSFVGLLITVIGLIRIVDLGMKVIFFPDADKYFYSIPAPVGKNYSEQTPEQIQQTKEEQEKQQNQEVARQRQRELTGAVSMIIVGLPLYVFHWRTIQKERVKS